MTAKSRGVRIVVLVLALLAGMLVLGPGARAATEVHFTAAGDYGARAATNSVLTKVADLAPDAHLALGDLAYQDVANESAWCDYVKARVGEGFPFQLISGNHESDDVADGAINNYSACLPNQVPGVVGTYGREYYMDFPKVAPLVRVIQVAPHLTFEGVAWRYQTGDPHYQWLSAAIDDGRAKGARWIVVSAHIPCLSVGTYNCPVADDVYRLLVSKKVDLVLHGHEHGYMRTHQLRSGVVGCSAIAPYSFDADCVADADSDFAAGQGTVFATVGTGGIPLRDINATDSEGGYFAAATGLNANPTYGLLDFRVTDSALSAQFVATSGGNFADSFTITRGIAPPNTPPTAAMTTSVTGLTLSADGSSSTDAEGPISSYDWSFGDGGTAAGATATHTYSASGTYTVTLTVTDAAGLSATTNASVLVTAPGTPPIAADTFARTVVNGFGSAEVGGPWTLSGGTTNFAVSGGAGRVRAAAATGPSAYLRDVVSDRTDVAVNISTDKPITGSGLYVSTVARRIVGAGDYRAKLRLQSTGIATLVLVRVSSTGAETSISSTVVLPGVVAAGEIVRVRVVATGTSPTTIRAKAWKSTAVEPGWLLTATDTTAALQARGHIGVSTWLSSTATNGPITVVVDDLSGSTPN